MATILEENEIEWEVVDREGGWHFPDGHKSINKAKEYADKGWTIIYNGKEISRTGLDDVCCRDPYVGTLTAGTGSFSKVLEFTDEENRVFYFKCVDWHAVNLM